MSYKIDEASEIWKDIKGYEGIYQISNLGRVRGCDRYVNTPNNGKRLIVGKIISQKMRGQYKIVHLYIRHKPKMFSVHRLVAQAFIPNPDNLPMVNHKDENPLNNIVSNLEWCTNKYNINYGSCLTKRSIKLGTGVEQIDRKTGEHIATFTSITRASKTTGLSRTTISKILNGKRDKIVSPYLWKRLTNKLTKQYGKQG